MYNFLPFLEIIFPSAILALVVYFILKKQHEKELQLISLLTKRNENIPLSTVSSDGINQDRKIILPLKIQAFERIVIFLERIEPSSLIMRIHKPGMSAKLLHADLLKAIREEYDHNVSQQIYISSNAWNLTQQAKEETVKIINMGLTKLEEDATSIDLSRAIFEMMMTLENSPSSIALNYIQKEIQEVIHF